MAKATGTAPAKVAGSRRLVVRSRKAVAKAKLAGATKADRMAVGNITRIEAVMKAAGRSGLLGEKRTRIGGRISPALLEEAKRQTGIQTDTDLIEFALANVALDDKFGETFERVRATVDPSLKLGF